MVKPAFVDNLKQHEYWNNQGVTQNTSISSIPAGHFKTLYQEGAETVLNLVSEAKVQQNLSLMECRKHCLPIN